MGKALAAQPANSATPHQPAAPTNLPTEFDDAAGDEAFLVNGSTSGGLAQSGMDEATRQRLIANAGGGRGAAGGGGGGQTSAAMDSASLAANLGMPPGMASRD